MTHSVNTPLPPPAPTTGAHAAPSTPSTPSTQDVARSEAANVGQTAQQAGGQVASTAADQAREVAAETQRQARDLLDQGRSQLRDQAATQQQKAATGLGSLAQELRSLADGTSDGAPGPARDLMQQASGKLDEFASWLQRREPADLLDEVRRFARRKPGAFLLGAAAAGVLAGRLTSGVKAAHTDTGRTADVDPTRTNYVDPAPAYSGYAGTAADAVDTGYAGTGAGYTGAGAGAGAGYTATTPGDPATAGVTPGTGAPLPPPPYGTTPPEGSVVPPTTPAGWDDPARRPGEER